ncbi:MAG: hypothetical protein KAH31_02805 [Candidatus Sabulitectum sp.]|nr:hypothetical protein [Candidatus Sabulitectum sp.]
MKRIIILLYLILVAASCRDAVGPAEGDMPEGPFVVWFNGLSGYADAYFIEADTVITHAWLTGEAANQIINIQGDTFAILSSLTADLRLFSGNRLGVTDQIVYFPEGSNPYSFVFSGDTVYAALYLDNSIAVLDMLSGNIINNIITRSNPCGIEYYGGKIFVSYANLPDPSSPGGVSVYDPVIEAELYWIDTGVNTNWLKIQPSGMLHCYSTTYPEINGHITIVDPNTFQICATVECSGAPAEAIQVGESFISPDGWGLGGLIKYNESGDFTRVELPFAPTDLAISGNTIYATSFAANMVYLLDSATFLVVDSLQSGGEGPQGIIAIDPSN